MPIPVSYHVLTLYLKRDVHWSITFSDDGQIKGPHIAGRTFSSRSWSNWGVQVVCYTRVHASCAQSGVHIYRVYFTIQKVETWRRRTCVLPSRKVTVTSMPICTSCQHINECQSGYWSCASKTTTSFLCHNSPTQVHVHTTCSEVRFHVLYEAPSARVGSADFFYRNFKNLL